MKIPVTISEEFDLVKFDLFQDMEVLSEALHYFKGHEDDIIRTWTQKYVEDFGDKAFFTTCDEAEKAFRDEL